MPEARRRLHVPEVPVEAREGEVLVWTDGACRGNPGPGGWAAIVVRGEEQLELSGCSPDTTNNRMEYTAALEGLRSLPDGSTRLHRDRLEADAGFDDQVDPGVEAQGLEDRRRGSGEEPGPRAALDSEIAHHAGVRWHWVRGHETGAGHARKALNDRADRLAVAASHAAA